MQDKKSIFIRKYKRASKSPWQDDSTVLLYADTIEVSGKIEIDFSRYIYLHRDEVGKVLGISISKSFLDENPDFDNRYLSDIELYAFLLLYIEEITEFCDLFASEFESLFLIDPRSYFESAYLRWLSILENSNN